MRTGSETSKGLPLDQGCATLSTGSGSGAGGGDAGSQFCPRDISTTTTSLPAQCMSDSASKGTSDTGTAGEVHQEGYDPSAQYGRYTVPDYASNDTIKIVYTVPQSSLVGGSKDTATRNRSTDNSSCRVASATVERTRIGFTASPPSSPNKAIKEKRTLKRYALPIKIRRAIASINNPTTCNNESVLEEVKPSSSTNHVSKGKCLKVIAKTLNYKSSGEQISKHVTKRKRVNTSKEKIDLRNDDELLSSSLISTTKYYNGHTTSKDSRKSSKKLLNDTDKSEVAPEVCYSRPTSSRDSRRFSKKLLKNIDEPLPAVTPEVCYSRPTSSRDSRKSSKKLLNNIDEPLPNRDPEVAPPSSISADGCITTTTGFGLLPALTTTGSVQLPALITTDSDQLTTEVTHPSEDQEKFMDQQYDKEVCDISTDSM